MIIFFVRAYIFVSATNKTCFIYPERRRACMPAKKNTFFISIEIFSFEIIKTTLWQYCVCMMDENKNRKMKNKIKRNMAVLYQKRTAFLSPSSVSLNAYEDIEFVEYAKCGFFAVFFFYLAINSDRLTWFIHMQNHSLTCLLWIISFLYLLQNFATLHYTHQLRYIGTMRLDP